MSFVYGGVDTGSLAGVVTTLRSWPSLGGHVVETVEKVGGDGRWFASSAQTHSVFVHEVTIYDDSPSDARRDNFVGLLDPRLGPRDLILETDTAWKFPEVMVSAGIEWLPLVWREDKGFVWRADVVMETVGSAPYAVQVSPEVRTFTSSLSYTLAVGNTSTFPTVEFPSGAAATVNIGGFSVNVGATPAGFTNVLDYQNFEFYRRNGSGTKVGSLVNLMSHFDRPVLHLGVATTVTVVGAPSGTRRLFPNARRI